VSGSPRDSVDSRPDSYFEFKSDCEEIPLIEHSIVRD